MESEVNTGGDERVTYKVCLNNGVGILFFHNQIPLSFEHILTQEVITRSRLATGCLGNIAGESAQKDDDSGAEEVHLSVLARNGTNSSGRFD